MKIDLTDSHQIRIFIAFVGCTGLASITIPNSVTFLGGLYGCTGQTLLYRIPTVQGSSGSPIIDAYGKFVGVNFAKQNGYDNFNFGIPAKQVVSFYNE